MMREEGQPIAPLPGQMAFRFMAEPRPAERFGLVSERAERKGSPGARRGGRMRQSGGYSGRGRGGSLPPYETSTG
jgi:hypothetical protein